MVDRIKIFNTVTEAKILMTKTAESPYLLETDGISWGEVPVQHNSYSNLTGIGEIITSSKLQPRKVAVTGRICSKHTNKEIARIYGVSTIEEIRQKKLQEIEEAKEELSKLINPLQYIRILSGEYYIEGKPNSSVTFSSTWKENNEIYCKFTFSLNCNDPLFHYSTTSNNQLLGISGGFHFPVRIPKPNGMKYGVRKIHQLVNVNNDGDIALGGVIYFKATGTVQSPVIRNVQTQEAIMINKTLQEGEVVKIDTINRKVLGAVDGENFVNYFQYWVFSNTWFQFGVGDTLFGLSAENETYKSLTVWVELNKSFYSMENQ